MVSRMMRRNVEDMIDIAQFSEIPENVILSGILQAHLDNDVDDNVIVESMKSMTTLASTLYVETNKIAVMTPHDIIKETRKS
jgi:hypothetical protein